MDDPKAWAAANPALGLLISHDTVATERAAASDEGFARERLGMWAAEAAAPVFDLRRWDALADTRAAAPTRVTLCVDVSPDRAFSTIGAAGDIGGGRTMVMCYHQPGTAWVAEKLAELCAMRQVVEVALFTGGQAAALAPDLARADVDFVKLSAMDMGTACAAFQRAVTEGSVAHGAQPVLDAAVANARVRRVGEAERWDRRDPGIADVSPLVACSGALWRWGVLMPAVYDVLDSVR